MPNLTRRSFGLLVGAGATSLALPYYARAQGKPKVVVIGGGAGGATAARYMAKDAGEDLDVTLIEANPAYTTCFFSNLYLGGFRDFDSITHGYDTLSSNYGITVVNGMADAVDRDAKMVVMADGSKVPYDRLVVSPGIDLIYDSVPGYSEEAAEIMPHSWKAGPQTQLLKAKLDAIENGQQIVMVAPPNPYRCPPGPYERVSMMAHILKSKGLNDSKIVIIDPKPKFSKQALFQEGWDKHYPGMIEWYGPDVHGGIVKVDASTGEVETDLDTFQGDLVNVIPAQKAGMIATKAALANDSGFCAIDPASMRSKEEAHDYRYFPDPDLLPLEFTQSFVDELAADLPELPDDKKARFVKDFGLTAYDADVLVAEKASADFFEEVAKGRDAKLAANWLINELFGRLNKEGKDLETSPVSAAQLGGIIDLIKAGTISGKIAKDVFEIVWTEGGDPAQIVEDRGMKQVTDLGAIEAIVDEIIAANPDKVEQAKDKPNLVGWFVGQVMKASKGKANPQAVNDLLKQKIGLE